MLTGHVWSKRLNVTTVETKLPLAPADAPLRVIVSGQRVSPETARHLKLYDIRREWVREYLAFVKRVKNPFYLHSAIDSGRINSLPEVGSSPDYVDFAESGVPARASRATGGPDLLVEADEKVQYVTASINVEEAPDGTTSSLDSAAISAAAIAGMADDDMQRTRRFLEADVKGHTDVHRLVRGLSSWTARKYLLNIYWYECRTLNPTITSCLPTPILHRNRRRGSNRRSRTYFRLGAVVRVSSVVRRLDGAGSWVITYVCRPDSLWALISYYMPTTFSLGDRFPIGRRLSRSSRPPCSMEATCPAPGSRASRQPS